MNKRLFLFAFMVLAAAPLSAAPAKKGRGAAPAAEQTPLQKNLSDLSAQNVDQRRRGAEALAQQPEPHALPALVTALSDEDAAVRAAVARALGLIRSPDASSELMRVLAEDQEAQVRQQAAVALGFIGESAAQDALIKTLNDKEMGPRLAAAQALASMKARPAVPALTGLLKDASPDMRRASAQALGEIKDPSASPALRPLLKDKDLSVKVAAAGALGKLKDAESQPALRKFLKNKKAPELRAAAAHALARQGSAEGREAALEVLKDRGLDPAVRGQAVRALYDMRDPVLLVPLREILLSEPEGDVKRDVSALADRLEKGTR